MNGASPLNNVNGSIVDWFYSNSYYDENKVIWCSYNDKDKIYKEVNGYLCVGVYQIQERIISREIFSNTIVNITDYIYSSLSFIENGGEYLIPVRYELTNYITWHASKIIIDETNKERLFMYSSEFECSIDIEANTIRLKTLAVQNEEELDKISSTLLKDYHILSNKIIVENIDLEEDINISCAHSYEADAIAANKFNPTDDVILWNYCSFIAAKHSLQRTGLSSLGLNGTLASLPHFAHTEM